MPETSYCTWRDYPDSSIQQMNRTPIGVLLTKLSDIPVNSLFLTLSDVEFNSHPPVVCVKTEDDGTGGVLFKFGLNRDHLILISGETLVIPLCGDYNG